MMIFLFQRTNYKFLRLRWETKKAKQKRKIKTKKEEVNKQDKQ